MHAYGTTNYREPAQPWQVVMGTSAASGHVKQTFGSRFYLHLRRQALFLSSTPLHPQWLSFRGKGRAAANGAEQELLDLTARRSENGPNASSALD